jgi:hypothetical protein
MYAQCVQQGVPEAEAKARVKMTDELVRDEWAGRQEVAEKCQKVHVEAMQQGCGHRHPSPRPPRTPRAPSRRPIARRRLCRCNPEEAQQRVVSCQEAFRQEFVKKMEAKKRALQACP